MPARRSVRLRLTLVYAGLFTVAGALLLAVTYVLVADGPLPGELPAPEVDLPGPQPDVPDDPGVDWVQDRLEQQRDDDLQRLLTRGLLALVGMSAVSLGLGWVVAGRVLRPLATMTATVRRISADDLTERLQADGPDDELQELADTFDGLLARLDHAFASQRQFVAHASHELRTPLTLQRTLVEVALADPDADAAALRHACERVLASTDEQNELIDALLVLARSQRGLDRREPTDLAAIAAHALAQRDPGDRRVDADLAPAPLVGDEQLLDQLVGNLVDNAIRHNVPGGWLAVTTRPGVIEVANGGRLIPPGEVRELLQQFRGEGHGLGLSIVAAVADAHQGDLRVTARPDGGIHVRVELTDESR